MSSKIKAMNKKQLADLYKVGLRTLNKWLEPFKDKIGEQRGKMYNPKQVSIIFECLGEP
jgi:hypothetical protein